MTFEQKCMNRQLIIFLLIAAVCVRIYFSVASKSAHTHAHTPKRLDYFSALLNRASFVKNIYTEIPKMASCFHRK